MGGRSVWAGLLHFRAAAEAARQDGARNPNLSRKETVMVPALSLWLPILLSAIAVFIVSSIIHMALRYHNTDFSQLPNEGAVLDALAPLSIPPGDYAVPHMTDMSAMKDPAFVEKVKRGPVAMMTVLPAEKVMNMGPQLILWFINALIVSLFAAYLTGRALGPGAEYLEVFRFAGTIAFAGYSLALLHGSIWYGRRWSATLKSMFDGFVYACVTAGVFGWLWP